MLSNNPYYIEKDSFAELYKQLTIDLMQNPQYITSPRGMKIKEFCNATLVLNDPYSNIFRNDVRPTNLRYLAGELIWYFSTSNKLKDINKYSKFWDRIANKDGTINSAYGYLLFSKLDNRYKCSWEWAVNSLLKDKDSRQAIIRFNDSSHSDPTTQDFVCTLIGVFHIREDKLNLTINMRSNDIHFGLMYDLPFFTLLMQLMRLHLIQKYPSLRLGKYVHFANSLHAYEKNFPELEQMTKCEYIAEKLPVMKLEPVMYDGLVSKAFLNVINHMYSGNDELFKWLQETEKERK